MLQEIAACAAKSESFAFETTLSGVAYLRHIREWQQASYHVSLFSWPALRRSGNCPRGRAGAARRAQHPGTGDSAALCCRQGQVPALRDAKARSPEELKAMQEALTGQFPTLADFERDFPSLCFALATGVGKTRLMGAFISYLHAAYGYKHFFVLAPNLTIYDKQTGEDWQKRLVKPFMLVIARDTTHAAALMATIESNEFFAGRYKGKVIQVDSSRSGTEEEEMIRRLLAVESYDEPTEIVIHVNMLKEGWDVTNLYTIVPLRAANARTLIEQSIGRGLRLPYGRKTGVDVVDRLNIIAHDKFQEVIDEAGRGDSPIRMQFLMLSPDAGNGTTLRSIAVQPTANAMLGTVKP
jgi:hypothetical protein